MRALVSLVTPVSEQQKGRALMDEHDWLAEQFEAERPHLRAVAYRMLGSLSEADDAVQESWLHLSRSDTSGVLNLGGWLTTVVARVCLNMLHSRKSRREESLEASVPEPITSREDGIDPEQEVQLALHVLPPRRLRINRREVKQVYNTYKPKKRQLPPPAPFEPEEQFLDFVDLLDPLALELAVGGP
jgi:DNA-directed RNA polymerase specialized sigma24 family protein